MDWEQLQSTHEGLFLTYRHNCLLMLAILCQVWVPAIKGFVPQDIIQCFNTYLNFCYITRSSVFT